MTFTFWGEGMSRIPDGIQMFFYLYVKMQTNEDGSLKNTEKRGRHSWTFTLRIC